MKRVLVGMSGGVDSSVSALLLKNMGYEVIGGTMKLLDDENINSSINDAKKVCDKLGIKHYVFDLREEFKNIVISYFISSYQKCETPNPCVICNHYFKFGLFFEKAKDLNCDYISTGHYANISNGLLYESNVENKDQSYFLWYIDKNVLPYIILPLSKYKNKDEIRKIAKENGLVNYSKKDSQDICFINGNYKDFIKERVNNIKCGDITLKDGQIIGKHDGLINYTIGQRKGLKTSLNKPLYVINFDYKNNKLIVGEENDLYSDILSVKNVNLLVEKLPKSVDAKIRSRVDKKEAQIFYKDDKMYVKFKEKQRAITSGQSIVFYKNGICLGGGIIEKI